MAIKCGSCKGRHDTVAEVRSCSGLGSTVATAERPDDDYARSAPDYDTRDREGGRRWGGGSRRAASEPMVKYVFNLARYKSMDEAVREDALARVEAHRRDDEPEPMGFDYAKQFINAYKNAAKRTEVRQAEPGEYASPDRVTQDGMYRDPSTGAIYKVQYNRANGSGRYLYAKQLLVDMPNGDTRSVGLLDGRKVAGASVRFEYVSGLIKKIRPEWRMAFEEAAKFGALYGVCMRCGRDLTAEESIDRAMGPVCAGKKNWA